MQVWIRVLQRRFSLAATAFLMLGGSLLFAGTALDGGEVPAEHLKKTCKRLPWGVEVWDMEEAVAQLRNGAAVLWVDTRPDAAFKQGSLRDALPLGPESHAAGSFKERLESAARARGYSAATVKIAFFCEEHSASLTSYQAAFQAVNGWGIDPRNVVWFREGYSPLLKEVRENPLLKRKARFFLNDSAMSSL